MWAKPILNTWCLLVFIMANMATFFVPGLSLSLKSCLDTLYLETILSPLQTIYPLPRPNNIHFNKIPEYVSSITGQNIFLGLENTGNIELGLRASFNITQCSHLGLVWGMGH